MNGQRPQASGNFQFNGPTIVALLYLSSFFVGLTGIVGLVLSYIWRGEPRPAWEASHYIYHIRTFWFGLAGFVVGFLLTIILVGFLILLAVSIWVIVRSVLALLKAQRDEPIVDPRAWLI